MILAKTFKGKNFGEEVEGTLNWHGKVLGDKAEGVIERLKA